MQATTGQHVELAFVDQGYTGAPTADAAAAHGIALDVVRLSQATRGFVLLHRRWVGEREIAWASRLLRLVRDHERLPETVAGWRLVAFACLMVHRLLSLAVHCP